MNISNVFVYLNETFNNRELATAFWISMFLIYILLKKDTRVSLFNIIKCALEKKLIIWYITMVVYYLGIVFILIKCGYWEKRLLKDTIVWFVTIGLIWCGKAIGTAKDFSYFKKHLKSNIRLMIILQFILNLYTFSFIVEVVLMIGMTILTLFIVFLDKNEELQNQNSKKLKKLLTIIQSFIGLYMLFYSIREIVINISSIIVKDKIKDISLPVILSCMFMLYIYLSCIYASYEQLFARVSLKKTIDDRIRFFLKVRIIIFCNINIKRINCFIERSNIMRSYVRNKKEVQELIHNYKSFSIDRENNRISV
ncbi:MAG: hypothetical protein LLF98_09050 [Clostridium sp.]|uniref:hypothetical protein n=1 Tax=Clostridium sp. TaxID=1506 RepID=UPI0025C461E4|nr:hypothetical protein [Clostridium sp.]MCE5221389.1 hypothetical protein [Clostridium sp.]